VRDKNNNLLIAFLYLMLSMRKGCIFLVLLLILPTYSTSDQPTWTSPDTIIEELPTMENVSGFFNTLPGLINKFSLATPRNLTWELVMATGKVDMFSNQDPPWLEEALLEFYHMHNITVDSDALHHLFHQIEMLPPIFSQSIALLLYALNEASRLCRFAFRDLTPNELQFLKNTNKSETDVTEILQYTISERINIIPNLGLFASESDQLSQIVQKIDRTALVNGALGLLSAIRVSLSILQKFAPEYCKEHVLIDPSNYIRIGGSANTTHNGTYALLIDLGGNDSHTIKPDKDMAALALNIAGNDRYQGDVASAFTGINLVCDLEGNDFYSSGNWSQAYACSGLATLLDFHGNDVYAGGSHVQGVARAGGLAVLADFEGHDYYQAKSEAQGCANGNSYGILADIMGDDIYIAENQTQGYGSSGGFGILVDFVGDDMYHAEQYTQGVGVGWANGLKKLGTGTLVDGTGDDIYEADCYSQGYGKFVGMGFMVDFFGSDQYKSNIYSQASSELFGIACLLDMHGVNTYNRSVHSGGYQGTWGIAVIVDGVSSTFNMKLWDMLQSLTKYNVAPFSALFGYIGT
jgi:hypothetical protein